MTNLTADFSATYGPGAECPIAVQFAYDGTGAETWRWDFGDGNFSNLENPIHTYYKAGSYSPSLIVTNASWKVKSVIASPMVLVETTPGQTNRANADEGDRGARTFPPIAPQYIEEDARTIVYGNNGKVDEYASV